MGTPPKRGRARRMWLEGYAEARRRHYVKVEDGYFATLEDLTDDPEQLYLVDVLRREKADGTGHYASHDPAPFPLAEADQPHGGTTR